MSIDPAPRRTSRHVDGAGLASSDRLQQFAKGRDFQWLGEVQCDPGLVREFAMPGLAIARQRHDHRRAEPARQLRERTTCTAGAVTLRVDALLHSRADSAVIDHPQAIDDLAYAFDFAGEHTRELCFLN